LNFAPHFDLQSVQSIFFSRHDPDLYGTNPVSYRMGTVCRFFGE
jgi:hypothetical protein